MLKLASIFRLFGAMVAIAATSCAHAVCNVVPHYLIAAPGQSVRLKATCAVTLTAINWFRNGTSMTSNILLSGGFDNEVTYQTPPLAVGTYTFTAVGNGGAQGARDPAVVFVIAAPSN